MKRVSHYDGPIVQPQSPNIDFQWPLLVEAPVIIVKRCQKIKIKNLPMSTTSRNGKSRRISQNLGA